jgi:hypothetical protein
MRLDVWSGLQMHDIEHRNICSVICVSLQPNHLRILAGWQDRDEGIEVNIPFKDRQERVTCNVSHG